MSRSALIRARRPRNPRPIAEVISTMADKLRAGVIGTGGIARQHIHGYQACGRFAVVALADLSAEAMAEADQAFGLNAVHYRDANEMLDREDLDVVSVCTWHAGHAPWTIAAAARRPKAILCEKPMADTIGRADEMLVACHRNRVKLVVGHQRRFLPAYTLARDLIAQGAIGKVEMMISFGGQGLPNYSSHQTDMFRYLLNDDECVWVMGNVERKTDRYERNSRIEDSAVGIFQFASGARATILADVTPTIYQGSQIYGSEGMISMEVDSLRLLNRDTGGTWQQHQPNGQFYSVAEKGQSFEWHEGAAGQAAELADWIEDKVETHRGCGENGYKALEMIHAVYESARCHEKVLLPLQTRLNPLDLMIDSGHLTPQRPGRYDIRSFLLRGENMRSDADQEK
jgi:predicted dehydrogenase